MGMFFPGAFRMPRAGASSSLKHIIWKYSSHPHDNMFRTTCRYTLLGPATMIAESTNPSWPTPSHYLSTDQSVWTYSRAKLLLCRLSLALLQCPDHSHAGLECVLFFILIHCLSHPNVVLTKRCLLTKRDNKWTIWDV